MVYIPIFKKSKKNFNRNSFNKFLANNNFPYFRLISFYSKKSGKLGKEWEYFLKISIYISIDLDRSNRFFLFMIFE